jgi:purine-binding chemotaxis protein CheW
VPENVTVTLDASVPSSDANGHSTSSVGGPRTLLVFQLGDHNAAFPIENVERITPMAQLARPPGLPSLLEGILNLSGAAVPVLRLDRVLQLPAGSPGLYSMLIVLKGICAGPIAMLVDRVSQIVSVPESSVLPVAKQDSFNACAEATVALEDANVNILSPARILLEREQKALAEFQRIAQLRLQEWASEKP